MLPNGSVIVFVLAHLCLSVTSSNYDKHILRLRRESPTKKPSVTPSPIVGGCRLPQQPKHGTYVSTSCQSDDQRAACQNTPGIVVPPKWVLKYSCNESYDLTTTVAEFSVCENGIWLNPIDCVRVCPPLLSLTVNVRCVFGGREVFCDRPMKPNTTATARCKQHHQRTQSAQYTSVVCQGSGEWDHQLFNCTPVAESTMFDSHAVSSSHDASLALGCRLPEYPKHGLYVSALCKPDHTRAACRGRPNTSVPNNWLLKYSCSEGYVLTSSVSEFSVCDNGVWHNHLDCVLDSRLLSNVTTLTNHTVPSETRRKRQSSCKRLEHTCNNGECIPSYNVCDGPRDCVDGSDETVEACRVLGIRCPPKAFECAYGACIDSELKCDGKSDCADGSDEIGCPGSHFTSTNPNLCGSGMFQCNNGECIDQYSICDANKDCSDASDETKNLCKIINCPSSSFQCDYGACLDRALRCNGQKNCLDGSDELGCPVGPTTPSYTVRPTAPVPVQGGCILPEHPKYGVYESQCQPGDQQMACRNTPGTPVPPNWLLKYSCNNNYELTSTDSKYSVCSNGVWDNSLDCIKLCPPLQSLSVEVRCVYQGREVSCDRPMKPNTTAMAKCKQHYRKTYEPGYSRLTCKDNGDWSYRLFYCSPVCGVSLKTNELTALIVNGTKTTQGAFPWLAALYIKNYTNHWDQQCAGTLITPHIVLTAAHCLVDRLVNRRKPEDFKVGLGKYHRDYYMYENFSQISDVREILIPRYYSGLSSYYALDIGLIDLIASVQVTGYIMPACVDWSSSYMLNPGDHGVVAGWGTTENRTSSEFVLSTELAYVNNSACLKKLRPALKGFVTHDKFCAETYSGGQVDRGDSGGGLTFVKNMQHFVYGVVSTKISEEGTFSLFTDITNIEHHSWLEEKRTYLDGLHFET